MRQKKYLLGDSEIPTRFIAAEPVSCPKLTRGKFEYDFGDEAGLTPLLPMYTLGHTFKPSAFMQAVRCRISAFQKKNSRSLFPQPTLLTDNN